MAKLRYIINCNVKWLWLFHISQGNWIILIDLSKKKRKKKSKCQK